MPYDRVENLPRSIRDALPPHAQEIYLKVFNSAWDNYGKAEKYTGEESREEIASKVAWAAVKKKYEKANNSKKWEERNSHN